MKLTALTTLLFIVLFTAACCHGNHHGNGNGNDSCGNGNGGHTSDTVYGTRPISIDTANEMISSYLSSVSYPTTDTNIQSLIVNADTLRSYLKDTTIKNIKLVFANTLSEMSKCGFGTNAGYSVNGFTVIIVGYNSSNNYVYNKQGKVYDYCTPCPKSCPGSGTASNCLIISK